MTINSLADFITQMPKELETITEKARYLYLELGKRSFYDTTYDYLMFGEEEQDIKFRSKQYTNPNIIVCTTVIKQLAELLTLAGIKSRICIRDSHYFLVYYDEQEVEHMTDITYDLKNIQFGCRTTHFATSTISQEEIEKIDLKLRYITNQKGYSDDYWYLVKEAIQDERLTEMQKLEIVLQNLRRFGNLNQLGERELFNLYQKYVKFCMPENRDILFCSSKSTRDPREKCYIELKQEEGKVSYLLNQQTRLFEKLPQKNKKVEDSQIPILRER